MKTFNTFILTMLVVVSFAGVASACDYSWETASDGSRCGDRAADVRPGGR